LVLHKAAWFDERLANTGVESEATHSLWKATRAIKRRCTRKAPLVDSNGTWCRTDLGQAEVFAAHLAERFQPFKLASLQQVEETQDQLNQALQMDMPITPFEPCEVAEVIVRQSNNKAPGHDVICNATLKALPRQAILYITLVFNAIVRLQYFPYQWKLGIISMIHKPGKPEREPASYRPISLLPSISKVFERLIAVRIVRIMEAQGITPEHQFGFRAGHCTVEQLHRVVEQILTAYDSKEYCNSLFLDIREAFDRVWHIGLQLKIKQTLPAPYFGLLKSYLEGRRFAVRFHSAISTEHNVAAGVPQGSVLGPLLYCLYSHDMPQPDVSLYGKSMLATFADDVCVTYRSRCEHDAADGIQDFAYRFSEWARRWNIGINSSKSNNVCFTLKRRTPPPVYIEEVPVPQPNAAKYLGVLLDRRLTFSKHVTDIRTRLRAKVAKHYWLLSSRSKLSLSNKLTIYKQILAPNWKYGCQIWGLACDSHIKRIQAIQNKVARLITGCEWFVRNTTLHRDLKLATVFDEINKHSSRYHDRLERHRNRLASALNRSRPPRRLNRRQPRDLITRSPLTRVRRS